LDNERYHSLASFFVTHFDEIPEIGSTIDVDGYRFEVTKMDGKRIDHIHVIPPNGDQTNQPVDENNE